MAVPFATLVDCHLNLNLTGVKLGMYAAALQIEDFKNETDTYAMSSVNKDYLGKIESKQINQYPYIRKFCSMWKIIKGEINSISGWGFSGYV